MLGREKKDVPNFQCILLSSHIKSDEISYTFNFMELPLVCLRVFDALNTGCYFCNSFVITGLFMNET